MIGAIKNELIKLIAQKKVISIVIITIILLGIGLIVQVTDKDSSQSAWQEELSEELVVLEDDTISNKTDVHTDRIKEIKFRLKHNISPNGDSTGPGTVVSEFSNSPFITILIPLFVILLFGNMIIGEINDGSLKISLVSPVGRSKILLSKIVANFLCVSLTALLYFIGVYIISSFKYGFSGWSNNVMFILNNEPVLVKMWVAAIVGFITTSITIIAYIGIAALLSVVVNDAVALTVVMSGVLIYGFITPMILGNAKWLSYLYITNMNIYSLVSGQSITINYGHSPLESSLLLLISTAFLYVLAFRIFKKKELSL